MEKQNKQSEPSFYVNFEKVYAHNIESNISLLNFLRHNCKFTGTKEGCSEGDCGACSVLIFDEKGSLAPVNSCILKVGQIIDKNIVTIEGASKLSSAKPLIQALNSEAASQCGFCTPGFVMAALALKEKHKSPSESVIHDSLSGNLCRCTGYRPIVNGIQSLKEKIKFPMPINSKGSKLKTAIFGKTTYIYPDSKKELIEFISKEKNYTVLSGGTDWNLEAEDSNFKEQKILFLNNIKEMSTIKTKTSSFEIGACVTLSKFEELCREFFSPFLDTIIRFGSPQIRTAATVGGNLGTSSPIGDLAPLFFVLEAELSLLGPKGERTIPIKDFFKGYRKNALKRNELIYKVKVPKTKKEDSIFSWKLSKRYDQDISTLSLAAKFKMDKNHTIENIILSAGGVGPTPLLLDKTSKLLKDSNLRFNQNSLLTALSHDISPISDLRGTAKYRSAAMVGLIKKMQRSAISGEKQHSIMSI
mgnify:FL=1